MAPSNAARRCGLFGKPRLLRYLALMHLMMTRDSCGDGFEMRVDTNGDILEEVFVTKSGKRTQTWVRPDFCALGVVDVLREQFNFQVDADGTERAPWIIDLAESVIHLRLRLIRLSDGAIVRLEVEKGITPRQAEGALNEWLPDGNVTRFLSDEPFVQC